jgi:hypothetical protein
MIGACRLALTTSAVNGYRHRATVSGPGRVQGLIEWAKRGARPMTID